MDSRGSAGRPRGNAPVRNKLLVGLLAQGVASISNFAIALSVAKILGAAELGRFSLVYAALTLATAIQSGWVGDTLVVLGPRSESAARWWQHVLTAASVVGTGAFIAVTGQFTPLEVAAYVLLVVAWLYEEYGRRWFMAHQRFLAQGVNDLVYLLVSVGLIAACSTIGQLNLAQVLACMAAGAAAAVVAGQIVVPAPARIWRRPGATRDLVAFREFGAWRSAQAASGALGILATRSLISAELGLRALGDLELGRTLAGPAMMALAGLGNVLLPLMSADARAKRTEDHRKVTALMTACVICYGTAVVIWAPWLVQVLGGQGFQVGRTIVAGWLAVAVAVALTQNVSVRALVHLPSRRVFALRSVGTLITLLLVAAAAFAGSAEAVPFVTALGTLISGALLYGALRKVADQTSSGG